MRQGDGSDLLGANDPRSASIGIIYVAPTDDRASVLEAILVQDDLGRKQVAVVLPENNRAFQRPVDFDGLKNMRRGLKAEIIFVVPGMPGPAEYARQRRFTVYSSLESYTTALRAEAPDNANAHFSLGAIDDAKGRRREAIEEYSAAVKADPTLPEARLRLADALRTSGQLEASLAQYERVVELDPRLVEPWIGGARLLIGFARYDRARDWLFRARRVHPERKELAELEARLPPMHR